MKTLDDFASQDGPEQEPYPYAGPEELRDPIRQALTRVVDPEVAMSIVDVGLVYGVDVGDDKVHVKVTMTSAACPVTDVILDDIERELDKVAPAHMVVQLELVWDPPWTMDRMSDRARRFMGW
ncbi:metal-sulfur cluster assembly factor [Ramlibacter sp. RBP-2]|uniref:Metal-sulfur cluster assembly factor n=1 Tax=Ramlibacter lithotrophicus TaxID=2606681 RepID=A0A7X6DC52_9BURK|nr:metal-sulfur cluster assembly factor [Ramlibacter lithotrophicus]NKE64457.1 metal-sulfur cluster assembly factor [Ramlibacter lithotrophicus]